MFSEDPLTPNREQEDERYSISAQSNLLWTMKKTKRGSHHSAPHETILCFFLIILQQIRIIIKRVLLRTQIVSLQFSNFNVESTLMSYLTFCCALQKSQLSLITLSWLVQLLNTVSLFQSLSTPRGAVSSSPTKQLSRHGGQIGM